MLTPQDVASHVFSRAVRGYNMSMVDDFLDELTDDYTALYKENAALKAKMKVLVDKVEEYRETEDSMRAALLSAQKMASNMVEEAEQRSTSMVAQAEHEARSRVGVLQDEVVLEQKRLNAAKTATQEFLTRTRTVCEQQLRLLEMLPDLTLEQIDGAPADISAIESQILSAFEQADGAALPAADAPAEETAAEPSDPPRTDGDTREVNLAELKFGRNYRPEE